MSAMKAVVRFNGRLFYCTVNDEFREQIRGRSAGGSELAGSSSRRRPTPDSSPSEPLCWSSDFCAAHVLLESPSNLLFGAEI